MELSRRVALAIVAALAVAASPLAPATGSAATVTFGADLDRPADNPFTCGETQIFPIASTCSLTSINIATGESGFPPAGEGIVSAVRVRVGPTTGPMQIVVEQALRQDNPFEAGKPNYACCAVVAMSPVFTPAANAITAIPVNFRVRQDLSPDRNGFYVDQHLALSVLSPNVPIPAALDSNSSFTAWFPAWGQLGEQRAGPAGNRGLNVLINADWDPVGVPPAPVPAPSATPAPSAPATAAPPAAASPARPAIGIPNRQALVRNARARVALACGLDTACAGRLLLQSRRANGLARQLLAAGSRGGRRARTVTYGTAKFRIAAGKRLPVRVKLNRRGKRLMRKQGKPKVWAIVRIKGHPIEPRRLVLKPSPPSR